MGNVVQAKHIGRDIMAGLKNIVGGEIEEYTKLQAQSREQALARMIKDAQKLDANAIINISYCYCIHAITSFSLTALMAIGTSQILK